MDLSHKKTTIMTSLAQIKKWSKQFDFNEGELEIILRCHASLSKKSTSGTFLNMLAHSFPYVFFFLPQDELEVRTALVEKYVLPVNFGERFKAAIYPIQEETDNEEAEIECFIDGIANCCRRKPENALGVLFDCCSNEEDTAADPIDLVKLCYSLSTASRLLVSKKVDKKAVTSFMQNFPSLHGLTHSLMGKATSYSTKVTKDEFISWGVEVVPFIFSCLPTFTHNLIFHGKSAKPHPDSSYIHPKLLDTSDILDEDPSLVFTICCMAPNLGGKWRRLFTTQMEETPANCLEAAIRHHSGPSFFVLKTSSGAIFGGCVESLWRVCYFLFQIEPHSSIYNSKQGKFYINHNEKYETESGEIEGYGIYEDDDDATKWSSSHVFFSIPNNICVASFMTPPSSEISYFEIWGFGDVLYD